MKKDFETSYTPMSVPPIASKKFFVTMVELGFGSEYLVVGNISHSYEEAQNKRVRYHKRYHITDSFVRGFDSKKEAQAFAAEHEVMEVA